MDVTKKQPTIQDVAKRAGVSTATVSRALSSPESVSEAKRALVQEAIEVTDYRVNRAARNLRTQRSNTILALLPEMGVLDGSLKPKSLAALADSSQANRVVFACEWVDGTQFPSVRSSNIEGASLAVKHLYKLGHRNIAHVMGPKTNVLSVERLNGFVTTCEELGLEHSVIQGDFSLQAGAQSAEELLKLDSKPTAVFCASDTSAFGLMSELTKRGLQIPGDISVVGFDDLELCEHFVPSLSTIRQDRIELGSLAAQLLLQCMTQGLQPYRIERLPVQLIERDSCAAA